MFPNFFPDYSKQFTCLFICKDIPYTYKVLCQTVGLVTQLIGSSWKMKIHLYQAWEPRGVTQSKMLPSTGGSRKYIKCSSAWNQQSVQLLCRVLTLCNPINCSTTGFPVPTPAACLTLRPSSQWCHSTISPSAIPFSACLQSFPDEGLFQGVSSSHQVAKVLEFQLQRQSFQWIFRTDFLYDWLVWSLCSPRDSQESSSTPQFKSINSLTLSFLYSPTLTSIHDYWITSWPFG